MNNRGVTLVEVMISMVILMVVFMGLIQASLLSINHNMRNAIRDEAVRVAAESMSRLRSFNYDCGELDNTGVLFVNYLVKGDKTNCGYDPTNATFVASLSKINTPTRNFRSFSKPLQFKVAKEVNWLNWDPTQPQPGTKRLVVRVRWQYPDEDQTLPDDKWQQHEITYTMRNPAQ